jgi:hypothetical protein
MKKGLNIKALPPCPLLRTGSAVFLPPAAVIHIFLLWFCTNLILKVNRNNKLKLGMMVPTSNSSTQEAEAGGLKVQGQPGLHNENRLLI